MPKHTRHPQPGKVKIVDSMGGSRLAASHKSRVLSQETSRHDAPWHAERGERHGNNRHMWATAKVKGRKRERQVTKASDRREFQEPE